MTTPSPAVEKLRNAVSCEVRCDSLTRLLYATDASIYQIEPEAVAFPRTPQEAAEVILAAQSEQLAVTPRGAGTGLAGGALGSGLIIDFARHNREIRDFNRDARTVRVGAGVVLDQLNAFLTPHGLTYGPDVATSSRATLGGMIANNSSGARVPFYGTTIDHVRSLEIVLSSGGIVQLGAGGPPLPQAAEIDRIIRQATAEIETRFHSGVTKRWPGFGLDRYLRRDGDLAQIIGGSEGTLAGIFSAELNLVPLPREKGLGLLFFASVQEAMQATVELLDLKPVAIEHIDDVLFDQTRGQLQFQGARALLELDEKPCKAILIVEFFEDIQEKLALLSQRKLGLRQMICTDAAGMAHVWNLRKQGLTLLTSRPGNAKPTAGIEDVAVPPERLPDYVRGLCEIMDGLGFEASFYGHAASGLLHVRPVVDMHDAKDIQKFRQVADGVSALTKQFKGAIAGEHGVGIARTEYMQEHLGPLLEVMRQIKAVLDPNCVFNPGKIIPDGRYAFDTNLRLGAGYHLQLPFDPVLKFARRDHSFVGNLEQCNGNGACRKLTPTMCPTYLATGDEIMSTRGRANAIRAALELRTESEPLQSAELDEALGYCLSCKACKTECPSNVDMALLKAELLHARHKKYGVPWRARLFSRPDLLGLMASLAPGLANRAMQSPWLRNLLLNHAGVTDQRPLPLYAAERFDYWFHKRPRAANRAHRGSVILWDDCFVRHNEPHIGKAAVQVLEAAGFEVLLPEDRQCCGRPAFSTGRLEVAAALGRANLQRFGATTTPILFLEPSCYSMFSDDYIELGLPGAEAMSKRVMLFEQFVDKLLTEEPGAVAFDASPRNVAVHAHCHTKALTNPAAATRVLERIPNCSARLLNSACCGMAGAFGAMEKTYSLSVRVAAPLVEQIEELPKDTILVASGTSCRHQIEHLATPKPLHVAEVLAAALQPAHEKV